MRWFGELAVQESKLARVTKPGIVARGTNEVGRRTYGGLQRCKRHERGGSANLRCKKVNSHGLVDPARLQEARARLLGELAVQEIKLARVSRPIKVARGTGQVVRRIAVQDSKLGRASRPGKVARGKSEVARRTCGARKLQKARGKWPGELATQESKLARVSRPGKVARGTSEVARRIAMQESNLGRAGRPGKTQQGCKRHERGDSANFRSKKATPHRLVDTARFQEARARWHGELAVLDNNLARVSRPGKVARGTNETQQGCKRHERGDSANFRSKKATPHRLVDTARFQEARARWHGELAVLDNNLARTRQGCKRHERGGSANLRCKKLDSHGLADPARLQEARGMWLGEPATQESKLARLTRQGCKKHEGSGSANLRRRKVSSHGLAEPARMQEARARWLGKLAVQEIRLARVGRPSKVARGTSEVARRIAVQESNLGWACRPGKVARGMSEVARRTYGARK
ncbi:hypothetical protein CDL15_Pgr024663 [Punica granatum]|uniref:Uncharacterized protein n=1 Tax=Punica granatum TaxID=22663 RepID=A0A218XBX9_PUNGR|nr:hypothetical protein CDL15_Pgr024663 [Punica granatum]